LLRVESEMRAANAVVNEENDSVDGCTRRELPNERCVSFRNVRTGHPM